MKNINLVVGFTPYHSIYSESVVKELNGKNYLFFTKRYPNIPAKKIGFEGWPIISFVIYAFFLRFLIILGYKINFYFPHACHMATNYLVFSDKCETLNVYEEGIANYYDADNNCWDIGFVKKICCFVLMIPYQKYSGHITGAGSVLFSSCYASRPKDIVNKKSFTKVVEVNLDYQYSNEPDKKTILFIDQPLSISDENKSSILKKFVREVGSDRYIFYKPHHDCNKICPGMLDLEDRYKDMPVEMLFSLKPFSMIVGFYSSALINMLLLCDKVEARYINAVDKSIKVNGVEISIYEFLKNNGVHEFSEKDFKI